MASLKKWPQKLSLAFLLCLGLNVLASFFWSEESLRPDAARIFLSPSFQFWLGTDSLGRDLLRRIILGARTSLFVGVLGAGLTTGLGLVMGVAAGWWGGWLDRLLMRISDIFLALPHFALLAVLNLFFQACFENWNFSAQILFSLTFTLVLTHWMSVLRVVRSQVIQIKQQDYLEAARALGGPPGHIIKNHVLPAIAPTVGLLFSMQIPSCLLSESFMSFVGLGVQPPLTSWGVLVSDGWRALSTYPHLIFAPSAVIFLTVLSIQQLIEPRSARSNRQKQIRELRPLRN